MTFLEQLQQHDQAVRQAQALERQRQQELGARTRQLTQLHAERLAHEREVGAGAARDPDAEARFAQLNDPDVIEQQQTHGVAWLDRRAEQRLAGAREAAEGAVAARAEFCARHLALLEAELAEGLDDDRQAVLAAAAVLRRKLEPLYQRERQATHLRHLAGVPTTEFTPGYDDHYNEVARVVARLERFAAATVEEAVA